MSTAPYPAAVEQLLSQSHAQRVTARAVIGAQTIALDVIDYTVDASEQRTPRVEATLTCAVPDEATIALLDPRTSVRIIIAAAYRLTSGVWAEADIANLILRRRSISRPDNTMALYAQGLESIIIEQSANTHAADDPAEDHSPISVPSGSDRARIMLAAYLDGTPYAATTITDTARTGATLWPGNGADLWDDIESIGEQQGFEVYDQGDNTLRIARRPETVTSDPAAALTVGATGTITGSDAVVDRDDWANFVVLRYRTVALTTGVVSYVYGTARVTAGPYSWAAAGVRSMIVDRIGKPSLAAANAAAAALLQRVLARGRGYTLTAISAWWIVPGATVTVQLPTGTQERHIVASVTHTTGGTMTVVTRLPDTVSTIGE